MKNKTNSNLKLFKTSTFYSKLTSKLNFRREFCHFSLKAESDAFKQTRR